MIIIQVAGGLGNQMQQYALYRKLISLGIDARLDISWFTECSRQDGVYARRNLELNYFEGLEYEACTEEEKRAVIGSEGLLDKAKEKIFPSAKRVFYEKEMYHPEIFHFHNKYLCGYFACEKYYADIMDGLRESIKFPASPNPQNEKAAIQIRSQESVSVHIRRGDYLDAENIKMFGNICTEDYYKGAIEELKNRYPKAHFYLFSDDEAYVREQYTSEEYTVVNWNKGSDSFYDMWLMSLCRHNVCANSTFSFWGARLNANPGKIMIRPSIHKNSQKFDSKTMHELWEGWFLLNNKGEIV